MRSSDLTIISGVYEFSARYGWFVLLSDCRFRSHHFSQNLIEKFISHFRLDEGVSYSVGIQI